MHTSIHVNLAFTLEVHQKHRVPPHRAAHWAKNPKIIQKLQSFVSFKIPSHLAKKNNNVQKRIDFSFEVFEHFLSFWPNVSQSGWEYLMTKTTAAPALQGLGENYNDCGGRIRQKMICQQQLVKTVARARVAINKKSRPTFPLSCSLANMKLISLDGANSFRHGEPSCAR